MELRAAGWRRVRRRSANAAHRAASHSVTTITRSLQKLNAVHRGAGQIVQPSSLLRWRRPASSGDGDTASRQSLRHEARVVGSRLVPWQTLRVPLPRPVGRARTSRRRTARRQLARLAVPEPGEHGDAARRPRLLGSRLRESGRVRLRYRRYRLRYRRYRYRRIETRRRQLGFPVIYDSESQLKNLSDVLKNMQQATTTVLPTVSRTLQPKTAMI